ncbi:hypothetical protein H1V43_09120 [Streptomyces sp. PSKA54]|uniref:Uncharacterized protein n=1 Tax=Streptomyces himalayensis subsp. aureolus TaxID=2758039 RepID=A0A7W2CYT3_9ACTN|nr:hypothetical protein [Streptomyces himalayensis]MBA4861543.1 hypothetical protein [Streptomyces himalayensis subsp. aureolus]
MFRTGRLSPRSWLLLGVVPVLLLALLYPYPYPAPWREAGQGRLLSALGELKDTALPGGVTAALSGCGATGPVRPEPRGEGERDALPQLVVSSYGYYDPGPRKSEHPRFTITANIAAGDRTLTLPAPVGEHRVTVDMYGPHGEGRTASARGLTADVVVGITGKRVRVPKSGEFRFTPGNALTLRVELPAGAVCPGHTITDISKCSPETTNSVDDCPVMVLTLSDPAIRAHRAKERSESPAAISDRLVAVTYEPNATDV